MSEENKGVSILGEPGKLEDQIAQDLAEEETFADEGVPQSETPLPAIDIASLSLDQLQALKAALSATPDRASTATKAKQVKIRKFEGQYVVDFKNAFIGLVFDDVQQRKVERHFLPIKTEGATEFVNVDYKLFMQSEQVVCEVLKMNKQERPIVEGETYNEHDQLVEMIQMQIDVELIVKTPEGTELTLPGKIANA